MNSSGCMWAGSCRSRSMRPTTSGRGATRSGFRSTARSTIRTSFRIRHLPKSRSASRAGTARFRAFGNRSWIERRVADHIERARISPRMGNGPGHALRVSGPTCFIGHAGMHHVRGPDGLSVVSSESFIAVGGSAAELEISVPDRLAWSPAAPNLYTVGIELERGNMIVDFVRRPVRVSSDRDPQRPVLSQRGAALSAGCARPGLLPGDDLHDTVDRVPGG